MRLKLYNFSALFSTGPTENRLRVVPHFSLGMVEPAERERA